MVWVRIDNKSSPSFYVSCVYNPKADDENHYQCMLNNFENVLAKNKKIVILGDLNSNYILDENLCVNQAHFIETLLCCKQLIVEPTRVTQSSQSVIDHIYTYPVWLGHLTHLLREAQSHWPPFCFHSQLCKNDTRVAHQKTRMPWNWDEYFKCPRKLCHFQQA